MFLLILILILCIACCIRYCVFIKNIEEFYLINTRITRPTRNMSYDLRGEVCYPPLLNLPFNNSSIASIIQSESDC